MPAPRCEGCGKRVPPDDRITYPTVLDDTGRVLHPAESWHTECLTDELDVLSEAYDVPDEF